MWIREGKPLSTFPCKKEQVQLFSNYELDIAKMKWADQILCATNDTRNNINNKMRRNKGFGLEPEIGDKIIGLTNHWNFFSAVNSWSLTNGTIGYISSFETEKVKFPKHIVDIPVDYMFTKMNTEDDDCFCSIPIDYQMLITNQSSLTPTQKYKINNAKKLPYPAPYDFAYAYAITTHKSQGSQWNKVLVVEERFPFDKEEHAKWLYTACTRASERLVVIKK